MPPLADLPHRGCALHGQVPEPVPCDLLLQWGHPLLERQHVEAHLEFQCLCEPPALTAREGMVTLPLTFVLAGGQDWGEMGGRDTAWEAEGK